MKKVLACLKLSEVFGTKLLSKTVTVQFALNTSARHRNPFLDTYLLVNTVSESYHLKKLSILYAQVRGKFPTLG